MNNLFYKSLATISTLGIITLSTTQVLNSLKKSNNSPVEISNTLIELKEARKEALKEVNIFRKESLDDVAKARQVALSEVKAARSESLKYLEEAERGKVNSVWLLMRFGQVSGASLEKIEMKDMDQCEFQGAVFNASDRLYPSGDYRGYECIEGK